VATYLRVGGATPRGMSSLQLWRASLERPFGARERQLVALVFPAFRAGVEAHVRWMRHRADLLSAIDALCDAVMACDREGRVVHQTPALASMLEEDPERDTLRTALESMADALRQLVTSDARGAATPPPVLERRHATARARYLVRGILHGLASDAPTLLVALERLTPVRRSETELRRAFGLTPAQVRVATLLAAGKSNTEIAVALGISPHTARRHTERVFALLGVRSRAEVGSKLVF
jgi:DNA-binding CsgD family transcriptional regulator